MRLMKQKQIFAVPTFAIAEYFAEHAATPEMAKREHEMLDLHVQEFHKQLAAGVPMAVGSDVGPFPHGTQAREYVLMVKYGMKPLEALQAGCSMAQSFLAGRMRLEHSSPDIMRTLLAVPGNPVDDISALMHVGFRDEGRHDLPPGRRESESVFCRFVDVSFACLAVCLAACSKTGTTGDNSQRTRIPMRLDKILLAIPKLSSHRYSVAYGAFPIRLMARRLAPFIFFYRMALCWRLPALRRIESRFGRWIRRSRIRCVLLRISNRCSLQRLGKPAARLCICVRR